MLEVVFSNSAGGSLKVAQHYGQGKQGGVIGVVFARADGEKPAKKELEDARRAAEERARRDWENAVPVGGDPGDVYSLDLGLSIGDISEDFPGPRRQAALEPLFDTWSQGAERDAREHLGKAEKAWTEFRERAASGEAIRAWYSDNPDECCGLCWFMARLEELPHGAVSLVKLPDWMERADGTAVRSVGWGEVGPGEWHSYLPLERSAPPVLQRGCADLWRKLQQENAPLRAVLNGRLVSVLETMYDSFIAREVEAAPVEFREAVVIGSILGKYQLGVGDGWIALRLEESIRSGELEVVSKAREGRPSYDRVLRKK